MSIISLGEFFRDPLDDADRHGIGLRVDTLTLVVLLPDGPARLTEYLAAHPERAEAIRQALRDRLMR